MAQPQSRFRWSKAFFLRLLAGYIAIPLVPPVFLGLLTARSQGHWAPDDLLGLVYIYGLFGFAAMVVLGTPLLLLYLRFGWTGFLAFIAGGAVCAGITSAAVGRNPVSAVFFAAAGAIAGLLFRGILFGFRPRPVQALGTEQSRVKRIPLVAVASAAIAACLLDLYSLSDEHRSVTEQMGWQCVGVEDTNIPRYPHVETVKLWFRRNPRYEERLTGPRLCAELEAAGQASVNVTFDVWGNRLQGVHGYDGRGVTVGSKNLETYDFRSGGFHDDVPHYGNYSSSQHPEIARFPLEVFK